MKTIVAVLQVSVLALLLTGCVSVAHVSDFKKTADGLDFDALAKRNYDQKDGLWNEKTGYEYFIVVDHVSEPDAVKCIKAALQSQGYQVEYTSTEGRAIIATRGLMANEWSSVAGVYYRPEEAMVQIYIRDKITQDITGGWRENRAKEIAQAIRAEIAMGGVPHVQK